MKTTVMFLLLILSVSCSGQVVDIGISPSVVPTSTPNFVLINKCKVEHRFIHWQREIIAETLVRSVDYQKQHPGRYNKYEREITSMEESISKHKEQYKSYGCESLASSDIIPSLNEQW